MKDVYTSITNMDDGVVNATVMRDSNSTSISPWTHIYKNMGAKNPIKRTKIPTQSKTKKCTFCGKSGTQLRFGKEKRTLCKEHLLQLNSKHDKYYPVFKKASEL